MYEISMGSGPVLTKTFPLCLQTACEHCLVVIHRYDIYQIMVNDMQAPTQMAVHIARKEDARQMAGVLYEGLRAAKYWSAIYSSVEREDWIEVQADFCLQHVNQSDSIAYVIKEREGKVTGMAYGRLITNEGGPKCKSITGRDDAEYRKMDNAAFHKSLIEKYGRVFCT